MFDHFLCFWKIKLNRSLDSTWLHHLLERRGLQTHFPQVETKTCRSICFMTSLNPIKAAKKRADQNRSGKKKCPFFWSPYHGTSRRHEPIKWGGCLTSPDLSLLKALSFLMPKAENSLKSHLQQKKSCTKPYRHPEKSISMKLVPKSFLSSAVLRWFGTSRTLVTPTTAYLVIRTNLHLSGLQNLREQFTTFEQRYGFREIPFFIVSSDIAHLGGWAISVSMPGMRVRCKCKASYMNLSHLFFTFELGFHTANFKCGQHKHVTGIPKVAK